MIGRLHVVDVRIHGDTIAAVGVSSRVSMAGLRYRQTASCSGGRPVAAMP